MKGAKSFFRRTDMLVVLGILVLAGGIWAFSRLLPKGQVHAEIWHGNTRLETVALNVGQDRRFSVADNHNVVFHLYADGSVCFEASDCPDKVCVRSGRLSRAGESAACLPNQLILKIVSDGGGEGADIVVG